MSDLLTDDFLNNLWIYKWNELVADGMDEKEAEEHAADLAIIRFEEM